MQNHEKYQKHQKYEKNMINKNIGRGKPQDSLPEPKHI